MLKVHITICKVYSDGTQEIVLDKANLITAGMGSSFLDIQMGGGSVYPYDYCPYYFQLGTNTIDYDPDSTTSSYFYQLSTPLEWNSYGEHTDLQIVERYRGFNASSHDIEVRTPVYEELLLTSSLLSSCTFSGTDEYFSLILAGHVSKFFMDSFESTIVLDEKTANGQAITEIGLFAKNPKGLYKDSPLLMAYRSFAEVQKTEEFSLVIHWTIGFLGLSTNVDDHYTGGGGSYTQPIGKGEYMTGIFRDRPTPSY